MADCSSYELRLAELDRLLLAMREQIGTLENAATLCSAKVKKLRRQLTYLRLARRIRSPTNNYQLWRPGLLLVCASFMAAICFVLFDSVFHSAHLTMVGSASGSLAAVGVVSSLLRFPTAALPTAIVDRDIELKVNESRHKNIYNELDAAKQRLLGLSAERDDLLRSVEWQRASLLQRNWKAMRDTEWEGYLMEVFLALGAIARPTGKTGDQGVDLVVQHGDRCIAVQAKGYYNAVSNKAVQEAVAGRAHYGCNATAVITNSRFTRSAIELAQSNNCCLIGETEFPDFVMGKIRIW